MRINHVARHDANPAPKGDTDMDENVMTISEMCEAFDVTPRALRFYESKELLNPVRIGQKRLYGKADRARLKLVLRGKTFGFSLEDIRRILSLYSRDGASMPQLQLALDVARKRAQEIIADRAALDLSLEALKDHMRFLEGEIAAASQQNAA